jgi:phytoene/squalene synthetase
VRRVYGGKEHFIVEKDGLPVMAMISVQEYEQLLEAWEQQQARESRLKEFERIARQFGEELERQGISEEDLDARVDAVRQRLLEENYGKPNE